jgi:hypothetical protein
MRNDMKICLWADGTWTELENLWEYAWMSDDYEVKEIDEKELEKLT